MGGDHYKKHQPLINDGEAYEFAVCNQAYQWKDQSPFLSLRILWYAL